MSYYGTAGTAGPVFAKAAITDELNAHLSLVEDHAHPIGSDRWREAHRAVKRRAFADAVGPAGWALVGQDPELARFVEWLLDGDAPTVAGVVALIRAGQVRP